MNRILIVDDDPHILELVETVLGKEGFQTFVAEDGQAALTLLETQTVDLAVIDVMMPGIDGWELCRALKSFLDIPVVFLTARGEIAQKVKGFDQGADDYIVKPFAPEELVARAKMLLKRYQILSAKKLQIGRVTLLEEETSVEQDGKTYLLPLKEFQLLYKLAGTPNKTFSREALIEQIWGYDYHGDERTVDVHIKRLREKFPDSGFRIQTIRGLGYRLEESK
ncbi:response regulator transcription factor [Listeria costaricensis]|uniref:response regulator transcription factor n=1 Tax=Listeria costaricensis TaxID=2026604 RepID=UPI000C06891A|nr:response regulator transcription factor [Listeria costaricensis]